MNKLLIFGLGYTAKYLTKRLDAQWEISATQRSHSPLEITSMLQDATHILVSIPPGPHSDIVLDMHYNDLSRLSKLKWLGYLSSTGVYGDHNGEWVDEDTVINPTNQRSIIRAQVEAKWLSLYEGENLPIHIFRLSGIYGPERSLIDTVRKGQAQRIAKPGHYFSRIHVEDIAQVLHKSMVRPTPGEVFNVSDDLPASSQEVTEYACDLLHIPYPPLLPYEQASLSLMAREFYQDNKKVCNNKLKTILNFSLLYPSYKGGLKQILELEKHAVMG